MFVCRSKRPLSEACLHTGNVQPIVIPHHQRHHNVGIVITVFVFANAIRFLELMMDQHHVHSANRNRKSVNGFRKYVSDKRVLDLKLGVVISPVLPLAFFLFLLMSLVSVNHPYLRPSSLPPPPPILPALASPQSSASSAIRSDCRTVPIYCAWDF